MGSIKFSLFEGDNFTTNAAVWGMFLMRLGISFDQADDILNGKLEFGNKEVVKESEPKTIEVIKEVEVPRMMTNIECVNQLLNIDDMTEKAIVLSSLSKVFGGSESMTLDKAIDFIVDYEGEIDKFDEERLLTKFKSEEDEDPAELIDNVDDMVHHLLNQYDEYAIARYILRHTNRNFLVKFYYALGNKLNMNVPQDLIDDEFKHMNANEINAYIDSNTDKQKADKYIKRFLMNDKTVPLWDLTKCFTYAQHSSMRLAANKSQLNILKSDIVKTLGQMMKNKSTLYEMAKFVRSITDKKINEIDTNKNQLERVSKYDGVVVATAKLIADHIPLVDCYITRYLRIDKMFNTTNQTLLRSLSDIVGEDVIVNVLKNNGYIHQVNAIDNRDFILNYPAPQNVKNALLGTNAELIDCVEDFYVSGHSMYTHYYSFIKTLLDSIESSAFESVLRCLITYRVITQIVPNNRSAMTDYCLNLVLDNNKKYKDRKKIRKSKSQSEDGSTSCGWYVKTYANVTSFQNPMLALNQFISTVKLAKIFKVSVGNIVDATQNIEHVLNNPSNWQYGTKSRLSKACAIERINIRSLLSLYEKLGNKMNDVDIRSIMKVFYAAVPNESRKKQL